MVQGWWAETGPVMAADDSGFPTEGCAKIYFSRNTGAEATGIQQAWWYGGKKGTYNIN